MRWTAKKEEKAPTLGTLRWRGWFAWWPVRIEDETRWLETVRVAERYSLVSDGSKLGTAAWVKTRFTSS